MPATESFAAAHVRPGLLVSTNYAEMLVKEIPAEKFAHMPHPKMNHPAFCLGHLSIYPDKMFELLGMEDRVEEKPGFEELFSPAAECVEQDGRYPEKDVIVAHFLERHRTLAEALPEVTDEILQQTNPMEGQMKELFPTIGAALIFTTTGHIMMHLGQISAWRRAIGMGSAM